MSSRRRPGPDLVDGYVSGPAAATEPRRRSLQRVVDARQVVLVEGITDQIAIETLAVRARLDLEEDGVVVAPMGGAHAIGSFLDTIGRRGGPQPTVRGLCDRRETEVFCRALSDRGRAVATDAGDLERLGFFVCDPDLEAELIRAVGALRVEELLVARGDVAAFRTLQRQAAWRDRSLEDQLHRFLRARARRMHTYARVLVDEVEAGRTPRPLLGALGLRNPPNA